MSKDLNVADWFSIIVSNGRWYLLSSLVTKALALLMLSILTHSLSPSEFGELNTILAFTQVLPIFLSLYLDSALGRIYHDCSDEQSQLTMLFSSLFWFVAVWGVLLLCILYIIISYISLSIGSIPYSYLLIATVPALLIQLAQLGIVFMKQSFASRTVSVIEVQGALISLLFTIIFVAALDMEVFGRLLAIAMSSTYVLVYVFWTFYKKKILIFSFDRKKLTKSLSYSLPLLPNLFAGWIAGASDRLIIANYINMEAVGVYSLASTLASLLYVIQDAVTQVTGVKTQVGMIKDRKHTLFMLNQLSLIMWGLMLFFNYIAIAYSLLIVKLITGRGYDGAVGLVGILGFVYVFSPINRMLQDLIGFNKKTWVISSGALIMAICSIILNFILIPKFGYFVAAYVLVFSTMIQTLWFYYFVIKLESLKLQWLKGFITLAAFAFFVLVDYGLGRSDGIVTKMLLTIAYLCITCWILLPSFRNLQTFK